jgi:uncharacterized protein (DUF1499 family)
VEESITLDTTTRPSSLRAPVAIALAGFALAALSVLAVLVAGWGNRAGWWDYRVALGTVPWAAGIGLGAAIVAAIGGTLAMPGGPPRRVSVLAIAGVIIGSLAFAIPWAYQARVGGTPRINDITTDPVNPPRFVDVAPLRGKATVKLDYGGEDVAAQQHEAYPDIAPAKLPLPPAQAFERALGTARSLGWEIVAAVPAEGRIEATDTTFMGLKDDVVIRVLAEDGGSRVDVRSLSRVGRNDRGKNAQRVREFLKRLSVSLSAPS